MTKNEELMVITMEECAELIHQCSKAIRKKEFEKNDALKEELCDVRCMLDLMVENKIITNMELNNGANLKRLKLMQWSSLLKK
tara:strand:- start:440 stop:688 length:249 start_codon:yes stop_codon:yes gene_type:complete